MRFVSTERYASRRSAVPGVTGGVSSSQSLATMAGADILRKGGTAADAAVAVAAALQVTQAPSTGLGGDAFCLYYEASTKRVYALNGSGRSPQALTLERALSEGMRDRLPALHPYAVTVPGAPAAWEDTVQRFGRLSLAEVLGPAIELADRGFPVGPVTSKWWRAGAERQLSQHRHGHELMIDGRGPEPGEVMRLPTLASSLRAMAEEGSRPFYHGWIARRIVQALQEEGGAMDEADLAAHRSEWVDPICVDYRGVRVWECPPNGQGLAALLALQVAKQYPLSQYEALSADRYHLLVEAMRLGFADAATYVADPEHAPIPLGQLLSDDYAVERAKLVSMERANLRPIPGSFAESAGADTVYFSVVDGEGNGCSFINSNFQGFGTGIVPEGCGFSLQNRGRGFVLQEGHRNCLAPRKRPYHTIIPGLATNADGSLYGVLGVMGGMMQPQGHLQVVVALVDDDVDPQAALDRPRFYLDQGEPGGELLLEDAVPEAVALQLSARGHHVRSVSGSARSVFGLGTIIRPENGVWWAGCDPRGDGVALGLP